MFHNRRDLTQGTARWCDARSRETRSADGVVLNNLLRNCYDLSSAHDGKGLTLQIGIHARRRGGAKVAELERISGGSFFSSVSIAVVMLLTLASRPRGSPCIPARIGRLSSKVSGKSVTTLVLRRLGGTCR